MRGSRIGCNMRSARAEIRANKWALAQHIKLMRGCVDCGYREHAIALQFDHVGDDKKASVSNLIRSDYSWKTVLLEIEKCEVRCANCHAVITAKRKAARMLSASAESDPSMLHSASSVHADPL